MTSTVSEAPDLGVRDLTLFARLGWWSRADLPEARRVVLVGRLQRYLNDQDPAPALIVDGKLGVQTMAALRRADLVLGPELEVIVAFHALGDRWSAP